MAGFEEFFRRLNDQHSVNFSFFYDSFDRGRLILGVWTTVELSCLCLVFSLGKNELCFLLRAGFDVLRQPLRGEQGFLQRPLAIEMLLQPKLQMAELVAQRAIGLDQLFNFRGNGLEEAFHVRFSKPAKRGLEPLLANIKGGNLHWLSIRKSRSKRPRAPNFCTAR